METLKEQILDPRVDTVRPYLIQIETTTVCNADCWMCPRDKATRSNHRNRMDEDVFKSVVNQAVEMGVLIIMPFIDGEPLADPRMVDFVEWIAETHPKIQVGWYTNAGLLTPEKATRLLETKMIPHFNVSMQGGDKETYERNMGFNENGKPRIKWETMIKNVEFLIQENKRMGFPSEIRANMCVGGPSEHTVEAFKERWGKFEGVRICLGAFSNFGGLSKDQKGESHWIGVPRQVCDRGTRHMYVFWNGNVGQCCFDLIETVTYGNINDQKLETIWNSNKMRKSRDAHFRIAVKDMPKICQACNSPKFHG